MFLHNQNLWVFYKHEWFDQTVEMWIQIFEKVAVLASKYFEKIKAKKYQKLHFVMIHYRTVKPKLANLPKFLMIRFNNLKLYIFFFLPIFCLKNLRK